MASYRRPQLPKLTFTDTSGAVIDYGQRWVGRPGRMPPEDSYSVTIHPERFAPLQTIAEALIAYLVDHYDATAQENPAFGADLLRSRDDLLRAVRVTPAGGEAAPLTVIFTAFPGVILHAGLLHDFSYPDCGCDACDEALEYEAGELEEMVMAVAEGRYREFFREGEAGPQLPGQWAAWPGTEAESLAPDVAPLPLLSGPSARYEIVAADGSSRGHSKTALGGGSLDGAQSERLASARARLEELPGGAWQPWPLRQG